MTIVSAPRPGAVRSARVAWDNPALRRVNLSLLGSTIGDGAYATALAVYTFQWGGPGALGAFVAAKLALKALTLPLLVHLVDRLPAARVLVVLDAVRAALVGAVAVLVLVEAPPVLVLATAGVTGLVGGPYRPVSAALTPSLVSSPQELTTVNGVGSAVEGVATFVGPALGGLLLAVTTVPVVFALDAATFLWSAALVLGLPVRTRPAHRPGGPWEAPSGNLSSGPAAGASDGVDDGPGLAAGVVAGFRAAWSDRRLRLVVGLMCLQTAVDGACAVFTVVVALQLVHLGAPGVGHLYSLLGVGAVAGGLLALQRARRSTLATDFGVGVLLSTVPPLVVAVVPAPAVAFAAFFVIGLGNPLADVNLVTLLQRLVPPAALGRVLGAVESATRAALALGALVVPLLLSALGPAWGLVALVVPVAAATGACWPALRRLDATLRPPALIGLVRAQALFAGLPPAAQELVAGRLERLAVPAGTRVIEAGETGDTFYLVESGRLDAVRGAELLSEMRAGDCFGEIALLRDVPRTASVVAVEDSVVHTLGRADFLRAVGADPETAARADLLVRARLDR